MKWFGMLLVVGLIGCNESNKPVFNDQSVSGVYMITQGHVVESASYLDGEDERDITVSDQTALMVNTNAEGSIINISDCYGNLMANGDFDCSGDFYAIGYDLENQKIWGSGHIGDGKVDFEIHVRGSVGSTFTWMMDATILANFDGEKTKIARGK